MLALTTYLVYNCLFSYVLLETPSESYVRPYNIKLRLNPSIKPPFPPKVFMHIFPEENQALDLNNYLPYIDIITKKYKQFKYQLIIVANDIDSETKDLSDQENNRLALNSLWSESNRNVNSNSNLHIKYTTFTKYFYDSPLEKYWRNLPPQFLKFLVRAISVWEKGGIAFDPVVLTPQSPNSIYIDKIYRILKKYNIKKAKPFSKQYKSYKKLTKPPKALPHNIRDVINALENNTETEKSTQEPLDEVETKDSTTIAYMRKLRSVVDIVGPKKNVTKPLKSQESQDVDSKNLNQEKRPDISPKFNLLPMFMNLLFDNMESKYTDETTSNSELIKQVDARDIVASNKNKTQLRRDFWNQLIDPNVHKPIIVSAKGIEATKPKNRSKIEDIIEKEAEDTFEVTIDLKGNIIATDTVCHAFLGGMFSNAIHHDRSESVTEFIIKELSIFCKGLLSSCVGIDVILL